MKEITGQMVKELRDRTGVAMDKCKEALVAAQGDVEKAIDHLRKAGMAAGAKKEGREAKEGLILCKESSRRLALVEANAETDFVAHNERFRQFLEDTTDQALSGGPSSLAVLMDSPYLRDPSLTLEQYRNLVVQALGENIQIRRMEVLNKSPKASYGIYSHMGGKLVVVVEIEGAFDLAGFAKDIAMHAAAESPEYISFGEIPKEVLARERAIALSQVQDKPAAIAEKIVQGKLKAFGDQVCLLQQKYIKDNAVTIEELLQRKSKETGHPLTIHRLYRWKVGQ